MKLVLVVLVVLVVVAVVAGLEACGVSGGSCEVACGLLRMAGLWLAACGRHVACCLWVSAAAQLA